MKIDEITLENENCFGEYEPSRNEVQCMKVNINLKLITTNTSKVIWK